MSDQYRYGDDRNDRYRQDTYRSDDYRTQDQGRSHGGRSGDDYRAERFGQAYGGDGEGRAFTDNGGYNPYANSTYGGSYGEDRNRGGYRSDTYGGQPYNDRQAANAMLHQGYRSPFGSGASLDRNDYRPTDYRANDGDNQRYQYNDYRPTHEQAGRFARTGAAGAQYGYGMDYGRGPQQERGFWDQTRDEVSSWFGDDEAARRRRMDEMRAGEHAGRGPKGYTRSDDRIREDLNDRLTDDHRLDASDIDVKVDKGEVSLTGHVSQRSDKRRAEDIADSIGGVKHVQNNLRVKESAASSYGDTAAAQTTGTTTSTTMGAASATRSN